MSRIAAWGAFLAIGMATATSAENTASTNITVRPRRGQPAAAESAVTRRFAIEGMHCKDCAKGLAAELRLTPGVIRATVSLAEAEATVVCDSRRVSLPVLLKTIETAGFRGKPIESPRSAGQGAPGSQGTKASGARPAADTSREGRDR